LNFQNTSIDRLTLTTTARGQQELAWSTFDRSKDYIHIKVHI